MPFDAADIFTPSAPSIKYRGVGQSPAEFQCTGQGVSLEWTIGGSFLDIYPSYKSELENQGFKFQQHKFLNETILNTVTILAANPGLIALVCYAYGTTGFVSASVGVLHVYGKIRIIVLIRNI